MPPTLTRLAAAALALARIRPASTNDSASTASQGRVMVGASAACMGAVCGGWWLTTRAC